jgi:hypothetical protein
MILLALAMVVVVSIALLSLVPRKAEPHLEPEAAMRAAVEMHRVHRDLDAEWTKHELRRDADALEHRIVEVIDSDDEP